MHDPLPDIWSGQRQPHSPGHCLRHPAYCISLRRHLIIRHRHQKSSDEYSTMRGFERQTTFTQLSPHDGGALCPVLLLAIVPLLQCLIYKLNFITGTHMHRKSIVYIDWIYSFNILDVFFEYILNIHWKDLG